jgi:hypothetical protein
MSRDHLQTMNRSFQQICQGEGEWIALGNFMNNWFCYAKDRREELIRDPLLDYDRNSLVQHQWATFCAASVEWFCNTYHISCPSWVYNPKYTLEETWFFYTHEEAKAILRQTTPQEFTRRNIFCGDNCFDNKWELIERLYNQSA